MQLLTSTQAIEIIGEQINLKAFRVAARRLGLKPIARHPDTGENMWKPEDIQTIKTYRENSPGPGNRTWGEQRRGGKPKGTE